MLRFLLWINKKIMSGSQKMNRKLEQRMVKKELNKKIRKKETETSLLTCREGLMLVIREDALTIPLQEWIKKNVFEDEYTIALWTEGTEADTTKKEAVKEAADTKQEEAIQTIEPQAKLSNLRIALQTTDGVKYVEMNEQQPMKKWTRNYNR